MNCIAGLCIPRNEILKHKTVRMRSFIFSFLELSGFNTPYGFDSVIKLLMENGIEPNDDSVLAFIQQVEGDNIGLGVYVIAPDTYQFHLVSGSREEIRAMFRNK